MNVLLKVLFHPLLMPMFSILGIAAVSPDYLGDDPVLGGIMIFFLSTLLPAIAIAMMRVLGLSRAKSDNPRMDQIGPMLVVAVFYLWLFKNLNDNTAMDPIVRHLILGACISLFLGFFMNLFEHVHLYFTGIGYLAASWTLLFLQLENAEMGIPIGGQVYIVNLALIAALILILGALGFLGLLHVLSDVKREKVAGHWFIGFTGPFIAQFF
jgi:hypothetical protein